MKRTVLLLTVFVMMVTLPALVSAAGGDEAAAKALFESTCSLCHSLENATDITDTPEGWRSTVTRMKEQNGCEITKEDTETIINYLVKFYGR